ncbi:MAG: arginase, partial [Pedobacter sp.]
MDSFKIYTQSDVLSFVNQRDGETKLGERILFYRHLEESNDKAISLNNLKQSPAKFVLLGIPEDIGVRANYGIGGSKNAWQATLKAFLNIQSNSFLQGDEILLLGHFEIEEPEDSRIETLREKTAAIDKLVAPIIEKIVSAGKIPIVIGGGHNNA